MDVVSCCTLRIAAFKNERQAVFKPRFQFKLKCLLIVVALLAGPMMFLRPPATSDSPVVDLFGPVHVAQDGRMEVQGGAVRISQGNTRTEIRANRIVVRKDGTALVEGNGTIVQRDR
jgi:hypothetical protein